MANDLTILRRRRAELVDKIAGLKSIRLSYIHHFMKLTTELAFIEKQIADRTLNHMRTV